MAAAYLFFHLPPPTTLVHTPHTTHAQYAALHGLVLMPPPVVPVVAAVVVAPVVPPALP